MRDVLRECLRIGTAVTQTALRRTEEAARQALTAAGVDPDKARRTVVESVPQPVREGAELAVGLVRSEAEKAWSRLGDGATQVGVVLETLERWMRDLDGTRGGGTPAGGPEAGAGTAAPERTEPAGAASAGPAVGTEAAGEQELSPVERARRARTGPGPVARTPGRAEEAFPRPARTATPSTTPTPVRVFVDDEAAPEAGARPATPRKSAAKKAPATPTTVAKKATAKKTAAKKAPAVADEPADAGAKLPAKKTAAKKTPAKKAAAKQVAAAKTTAPGPAAKKTTARKTTARKSAAGQDTLSARPAQSGQREGGDSRE